MDIAAYDYDLPADRIAQTPPSVRGASRMMVVSRSGDLAKARMFQDFPDYLQPGDCLVLNDTRVIPARVFGTKDPGGARVEALLLEALGDGTWQALLRPGRRLKPGTKVKLDGADASFTVCGRKAEVFTIRFDTEEILSVLQRVGAMPLPPYIQRSATSVDGERYQTVYAEQPGAVAAPTAGLHFTDAVLAAIQGMGVTVAKVTLHVGLGTFQPVSAERLEDHMMHEERYCLSPETAAAINTCRQRGGRVVAVGTTCVRTLETCAAADGRVEPGQGRTDLFMYPPYEPRAVDMLLTNFHLPRSTLLMLVSCFIGRERLLSVYRQAIEQGFRFYSYGDCMLITP